MMESETIEMVKMMIEMRKLPNRVKGCPVWDKLTLDLWKDAVAGKINGLTGSKTEIEFMLGKISIFIDEKNNVHMKGPVSNIKEINIKV